MSEQTGSEMADGGVTLVQVFGEFREFRGSMTTRMRGFERELKNGLTDIKDAVDDSNKLTERLTMIENKQALMYKIISALGGIALVLLAEAARRLIFGA